ncbi:two-component system phosphate regulon sensor histidine kinase PhoR [Microbacterium testaceum]|uniref:sensor histidine kinase n=1 Tax=Microbacterium TaxID=33882 RepID=UPI00277E93D9|nr:MULTISPECIES: PAS domain-containing sensor histidine kinase [Microbacterium]MDQ1112731.1 two-component system phosphate regulon sensor histidine kinase PhoR [Microbacterium testaceum]MDR6096730.1 two-component system phosphate regulon sensor histidine kinase PhoR [Microbacterium sp. SORGH_AS_0454]
MASMRSVPPAIPSEGTPDDDATNPGSRTRSIWLLQLVLGASVVITVLLVQALEPSLFSLWPFSSGVGVIIALTAIAIVVPWQKIPRSVVAAVPFGDILGIGLLSFGTDLRFGFFWVFPIIWIATHFTLVYLISALSTVGMIIVVDATVNASGPATALRLIVVLLSLTFIGITSFLSARQTRAFKQLLRRQASRLQGTLQRVSGQERRVSQMLNGLDTGIARLSADGEVLALNDTYVALYGVERDEPQRPGAAVEYATLRGEPLPEAERPFARASRGEQFDDERVWLFDPHGEWHALSASTRRLVSSDEPESTLLIVHDITALIESERARERLAATVSHELRNPLTAIIGHADLALDDPDLSPKVREQLEVIAGAGERMQKLISEILATSRGVFRESSSPAAADASRIIASSLASFRPAAAARRVSVIDELPDTAEVVGDAFRLRQAFDNILSNAIKYTPAGGTIRISGELSPDDVVLHFADTGIGIHPDDLERVFDPYFRAQSVRESPTPGTGLGMGIIRSIVEEQGGSLFLESELGAGTTVTVILPSRIEAGTP